MTKEPEEAVHEAVQPLGQLPRESLEQFPREPIMLNSGIANFLPETKRKRGRPKKSAEKPTEQPPKKEKVRPACESRPMEYPNRIVVWGTEPVCARFKRKGLAILYDPSRGKHYILMPVTDDGGALRWRYRWMHDARDKYRYEQIDLEPGEIPLTIKKLREIADALEQGLEWIGGEKEAVKVGPKIVEEIKQSQSEDKISEFLKKHGGVF